jgi:hypothetical protein
MPKRKIRRFDLPFCLSLWLGPTILGRPTLGVA